MPNQKMESKTAFLLRIVGILEILFSLIGGLFYAVEPGYFEDKFNFGKFILCVAVGIICALLTFGFSRIVEAAHLYVMLNKPREVESTLETEA